MRTAVPWGGVPGVATGDVLSLRNAKQPARTSANQTTVRSAGRLTIAITTPLNMALASSLETLYSTPAYTKRRGVSPSSWDSRGESRPDARQSAAWSAAVYHEFHFERAKVERPDGHNQSIEHRVRRVAL